MINIYTFKQWRHIICAQICTLAMAISFNSTWRIPRDAFRFGGLSFGLAHSIALIAVALPIVMLQLAIGQLCQGDAVGIWRAVPIFKGVGYLRLLISFLGSVCSIIYIALITTCFLHTINNSNPFNKCIDLLPISEHYEDVNVVSSMCLNSTNSFPEAVKPEYYLSMGLIITSLWIVCPFMLYDPLKQMKRIFYILTPFVIILFIIIVSCIGDGVDILTIKKASDWRNLLEPYVWQRALIQALWCSQIAGGYLVSTSDTIYSNIDVEWSAFLIIGTNLILSWFGILFWFGIGGSNEKDTTAAAVLFEIFNIVDEKSLDTLWSLLLLGVLFLSGVVTMLSLLYPVYERFRVIGGQRWRLLCVANSLAGIAVALSIFVGRFSILDLLEDIALSFLISLTTIIEISAFIFIYGWKLLVEDVEFLIGNKLRRHWILGWYAAPGVLVPTMIWWLTMVILKDCGWDVPPYEASAVAATAVLTIFILITFAAIVVVKQVHYDFIEKLISSFKPSRHWGPRDPITHYYWLARREEILRGLPPTVYQRWQFGQLTGTLNFSTDTPITGGSEVLSNNAEKKRANSDDWLYTVYRKQCIENIYCEYSLTRKCRSKSLEMIILNLGKGDNSK